MADQTSNAESIQALTALDYAEIHKLYADYALALDTGDGAGRAATFTEDGTFSSVFSQHEPEPAQSAGARTTRQGNTGVRHMMANISICASAEGADGRCNALITAPKPGTGNGTFENPPALNVITGYYHDKLVRTSHGWRFKSRQVWVDFDPESPYRPQKR